MIFTIFNRIILKILLEVFSSWSFIPLGTVKTICLSPERSGQQKAKVKVVNIQFGLSEKDVKIKKRQKSCNRFCCARKRDFQLEASSFIYYRVFVQIRIKQQNRKETILNVSASPCFPLPSTERGTRQNLLQRIRLLFNLFLHSV